MELTRAQRNWEESISCKYGGLIPVSSAQTCWEDCSQWSSASCQQLPGKCRSRHVRRPALHRNTDNRPWSGKRSLSPLSLTPMQLADGPSHALWKYSCRWCATLSWAPGTRARPQRFGDQTRRYQRGDRYFRLVMLYAIGGTTLRSTGPNSRPIRVSLLDRVGHWSQRRTCTGEAKNINLLARWVTEA